MKRILSLVAALAFIVCVAPAQLRVAVPGVPVTVSGTPVQINNNAGAMVISFEEVIAGSPATVSIPIVGCMQGHTCDTLETNTSTSNSIRNPAITKVYDYFQITPSWTGGTNVSVTVNVTLTTAQSRSGGGGTWGSITGTLSAQTDLQNALNLLAADSSVVHNTGNETIAGQKLFTDPMTVGDFSVTGQFSTTGTFDLLSGWPVTPCSASSASHTRICIDTDGSIKQSINGATPSPFASTTSFPDGTTSLPGWPATNHPELGLVIVPSATVLPITNVARTSNVDTITVDTTTYTGSGHQLNWPVGATVKISSLPVPFTSFNGDCTVTAVTSTTFSCNQTGTDVASSATTGNSQIYSTLLAGYEIALTRLVSTSTNPAGWGSIRFAQTDPITRAAHSNSQTTLILLRGKPSSDRAQVGDTTGVYFPGPVAAAAATDPNDEGPTDAAWGVDPTSHEFYCHYGTTQVDCFGFTGDFTTSAAHVGTLATVNAGSGTCGDSTHVCQVTTNAKGLVTSQSAVAISGGSTGNLNLQGPLTEVTGTGSSTPLYTYSVTGNTVPAGHCLKTLVGWKHTTGTANVTYSFSFGSFTSSTFSSTQANNSSAQFVVCNITTSSQAVMVNNIFTGASTLAASFGSPSINTTSSQTLTFNMSVANTDGVTPEFWSVALY